MDFSGTFLHSVLKMYQGEFSLHFPWEMIAQANMLWEYFVPLKFASAVGTVLNWPSGNTKKGCASEKNSLEYRVLVSWSSWYHWSGILAAPFALLPSCSLFWGASVLTCSHSIPHLLAPPGKNTYCWWLPRVGKVTDLPLHSLFYCAYLPHLTFLLLYNYTIYRFNLWYVWVLPLCSNWFCLLAFSHPFHKQLKALYISPQKGHQLDTNPYKNFH